MNLVFKLPFLCEGTQLIQWWNPEGFTAYSEADTSTNHLHSSPGSPGLTEFPEEGVSHCSGFPTVSETSVQSEHM